MYLGFFGLRTEPFHITPDPDFLYLSPSHKEAYAAVVYGVAKRKGFVTLTGEVGTGKTTVLRAYLKKLDREVIRPIYLFNPDLSFQDLMRVLLHEMGMDPKGRSEPWMLQWFHWMLIQEYREGHNVVLLIDEAQNMPVETLERLRMLTNIETTKEKLLQIVLVGQPELEDKLNLHSLRQLKQRVAVGARINALSPAESGAYIRHRIERAMGSLDMVFEPAAVKAITAYAKGNPRVINIVCDNALIAGFGSQQRPITAKIVKQVIADIRGRAPRRYFKWFGALATATLLLTAAVTVFSWGKRYDAPSEQGDARPNVAHAQSELTAPPPQAAEAAPAFIAPTEPPASAEARVTPSSQKPEFDTRSIALNAMLERTKEPTRPAAPLPPELVHPPAPRPMPELPAASPEAMPTADGLAETISPSAPAQAQTDTSPLAEPTTHEPPAAPEDGTPGPNSAVTNRMVKPGDCLIGLTRETYGFCDAALLAWVGKHNSHLENFDRILVGEQVYFPSLDSFEHHAEGASSEAAADSTSERDSS